MTEKKSGLFSRLANQLSGAFKGTVKSQPPVPERGTRVQLPTEEKSVSGRPVIVSENAFMEHSFQAAPESKTVTSSPSVGYSRKNVPVPGRTVPKQATVAPKIVTKKRKRKRYPDEKRLRKVFKTGQYLSKVRQRRHAIQKAKARAATRKMKVKIKKSRLTPEAVTALEQEIREVSPNQPLPMQEETEATNQVFPDIVIREEGQREKMLRKNKDGWEENQPAVPIPPSMVPASEEPKEALFPAEPPSELPGTQKVHAKAGKPSAEEMEREQNLESEIRSEISKQRAGSTGKKPAEPKKAGSSAEKRKTGKGTVPVLAPEKQEPKSDAEELQQMVAEKFEGRIAPEQMQELQQKIGELLEQKRVTRGQLEEHIRSADSDRMLEGFTKLLSMVDVPPEKPKDEMPTTIGPQQKPEKYSGTEKELEKKELVTDFDKILEIVHERGTTTLNELASELGMNKRLLKEAVDILEENNLLIQEFPAFGSARIIDPSYTDKKGKKSEKE